MGQFNIRSVTVRVAYRLNGCVGPEEDIAAAATTTRAPPDSTHDNQSDNDRAKNRQKHVCDGIRHGDPEDRGLALRDFA
jgi:hypothetical protein